VSFNYEPEGRVFESPRAHHRIKRLRHLRRSVAGLRYDLIFWSLRRRSRLNRALTITPAPSASDSLGEARHKFTIGFGRVERPNSVSCAARRAASRIKSARVSADEYRGLVDQFDQLLLSNFAASSLGDVHL
jgi:hypothetical protein